MYSQIYLILYDSLEKLLRYTFIYEHENIMLCIQICAIDIFSNLPNLL